VTDENCLWCGESATHLCDTLLHTAVVLRRLDELGRERESKQILVRLSSLDDIPTCDAPICGQCREKYGTIFTGDQSSDQRIETIDRCPYCVTQGHVAHLQVEAVGHRERCRAHGAAALARHAAKGVSFPALLPSEGGVL
jgi:hypothetical protein